MYEFNIVIIILCLFEGLISAELLCSHKKILKFFCHEENSKKKAHGVESKCGEVVGKDL